MRKGIRKAIVGIATVVAMSVVLAATAFADGGRVVTIGADLDDAQRSSMISYFGANLAQDTVIPVNNQQERALLSSWVPIEQIGSRTISCAYVRPTTSGGIQVKTANLTWVTANMLASSLSTSGVANCEVIAAAPFPVSGTGALTGVLLAYENATGTTIDAGRKNLAAREMVATATLSNEIGPNAAANVVNDVKMQIVNGMLVNDYGAVTEEEARRMAEEAVAKALAESDDETIRQREISNEMRAELVELANELTKQKYDWQQMAQTVESIDKSIKEEKQATTPTINNEVNVNPQINVNPQVNVDVNPTIDANAQGGNAQGGDAQNNNELPADSILTGTNEEALAGAPETATSQEAVNEPVVEPTAPTEPVEQNEVSNPAEPTGSNSDAPFEIVSEDSVQFPNPDEQVAEQQNPQVEEPTTIPQEIGEEASQPAEPTGDGGDGQDVQEIPSPEPQEIPAPEVSENPENPENPDWQEVPTEEPNVEAGVEQGDEGEPNEEEESKPFVTELSASAESVLAEFMNEYPDQEDFDSESLLPLPAKGEFATLEDGETTGYAKAQDDGTGHLTLSEIDSSEAKSATRVDGIDGLWKKTDEYGETSYWILYMKDGKYACVPADEYGNVTDDPESLRTALLETEAEWNPQAEQTPNPEQVENQEQVENPAEQGYGEDEGYGDDYDETEADDYE